MANTYEMTASRRVANALMKLLLRVGMGPKTTYLMTVRGRKSGKMHSTPVTLVKMDGQRWLVAPYGEVGWVFNARAAGQVTLTRGRRSETVTVTEVGPDESAPVLKEYVTRIPIVRPYFDATPESSLEKFAVEANRHPVFRLGSAPE